MSRSKANFWIMALAALGVILAGWLTVEHFLPQAELPCGFAGGGCSGVLNSWYSHVGPIPVAAFGLAGYLAIVVLAARRQQQIRELTPPPVPVDVAFLAAANARTYPSDSGADRTGFDPSGADFGGTGANGAVNADAGGANDVPLEGENLSVTQVHPGVEATPAPSNDEAASVPSDDEDAFAQREAAFARSARPMWILSGLGFLISWVLQFVVFKVLHSFCPYCFASASLMTLLFLLSTREAYLGAGPVNEWQKLVGGVVVLALVGIGFTGYSDQEQRNAMHEMDQAFAAQLNAPPPISDVSKLSRKVILGEQRHLLGNPNAPFKLVEFGDYQCPSCQKASLRANQLIQQSNGKVALIFRNRPIPKHEWAMAAARSAEAAGLQGKFWEMHDLQFKNGTEFESPLFDDSKFDDWARQVGLDVARFDHDRKAPITQNLVNGDSAAADKLKAISTPTFFLVGPRTIYQLLGPVPLEQAFADQKQPMWKQ